MTEGAEWENTQKQKWFCLECGTIYPWKDIVIVNDDGSTNVRPCPKCAGPGYSPFVPFTEMLQQEVQNAYKPRR